MGTSPILLHQKLQYPQEHTAQARSFGEHIKKLLKINTDNIVIFMKNILILSVFALLACSVNIKESPRSPTIMTGPEYSQQEQKVEISDECRLCSSDQVCVRNQCLAAPVCLQPERWCAGRCRNIFADNDNCGKCGLKCPGNKSCDQGICILSM